MLILSRALAKQFKAVFLRALGTRLMGLTPLRAEAGADGLRVTAASSTIAVEYHDPAPRPNAELHLPYHLLKEIAGSKSDPVNIAFTGERITANWHEGSIPRTLTTDAPAASEQSFPVCPEQFVENTPSLLRALADAVATTDAASSRYALGCLQLRGVDGSIAATDGRQALLQTGFQFPFEDALLVHACDLFDGKALPCDELVQVGKTDTHVAFRIGCWTIYLAIEKDVRFPRIDDIIPNRSGALAEVELCAADCEFAAGNLRRLPANKDTNAPITVELNGCVALRAKSDAGNDLTELILSNSRKTGDDVALAINRRYLERAADMRFSNLYVFQDNMPILCEDERRRYVWARLDKDSVLRSSEDAIRIESPSISGRPSQFSNTRKHSMRKRKNELPATEESPPVAAPSVTNALAEASPAVGPIEQALTLRSTLRSALTATNELIRAIKRQKRQDRAYKSALASLRQIQQAA